MCAGAEAGIRCTTITVASAIAHSHISPRNILFTEDQLTKRRGRIGFPFTTGRAKFSAPAGDQLASSVPDDLPNLAPPTRG